MAEGAKHSREISPQPDTLDPKNDRESLSEEQKKEFTIESGGQKFDFLEIQSASPSNTLLVHLPGFGEDAEQYAKPMHILMGKSYCTLTLKGYGEAFSKEALVEALEQA